MLELWIPVTIVAGFFQNLRSAVQKKLKDNLTTAGAAYSRFVYALPISILYMVVLCYFGDLPVPEPNAQFFIFCLVGGVCQIFANVTLLWIFSFKSFAVGTIFSKLEVIMVAAVAAVVLGETLNRFSVLSICISSLGVFALSMGQNKLSIRSMLHGLLHRATFYGLLSAAFLGASSALYRGATQALNYKPFYANAAFTLVIALTIQTLLMGTWIFIKDKNGFIQVFKQWRWAGLAGITGALASLCWFTAFTLQKAAYVRALGQSELLFTFIATLLFFREKVTLSDTTGVILITAGIIILLVLG